MLLTYEQVRAYELPATGGKHGDPRWPAFAARYGFDPRRPVQWEVEALEPAELRRLVLAAVDPYIDRDVLARQIAARLHLVLATGLPPAAGAAVCDATEATTTAHRLSGSRRSWPCTPAGSPTLAVSPQSCVPAHGPRAPAVRPSRPSHGRPTAFPVG
ncbi:hypothetical protein [Streptomyces olivaceoviridis]|uniref:hypothetical protein n=1 Tax=Streptomyces olivaceoviridis TaxID=1921 RepID=UPI00378BD76A